MKKFLIFFLFVLIYISNTNAQISDIKKKADDEKSKKTENTDYNNNNSENIGHNSDPGPCAAGCAQACGEIFVQFFVEMLAVHHRYIMDSIDDPTKLSFEICPHAAFGIHFSPTGKMYDYLNFLPSAKFRWGVWSTIFRYNYLLDFTNFSADAFKTWSWDVFIVNIQPVPEFKLMLGTGLAYSPYIKSIYGQWYGGIDVSESDRQYYGVLEGRLATNYESSPMFGEVSFQGNYRFFETGSLNGYFMLGGVYQNYYASHDIWAIQAGFTFNIH